MIKIIKQGKPKHFTKTCPKCDCEFEYDFEDVVIDSSICLTTYPCKFKSFVKCPCCGELIFHDFIVQNHSFIYDKKSYFMN